MNRTMLRAKINRATVTHANLHYVGSVTVDLDLLEEAEILPGELVSIADTSNGARLDTYTIAGERGSGVVGINGAAAHLIHPGDLVTISTYVVLNDVEAKTFQPRIVQFNEQNLIPSVGTDPAEAVRPRTIASRSPQSQMR